MNKLKKFWYIPFALLAMIALVAASPTPRKVLSEAFTDWIRVYGDWPIIYLDRENDTGSFWGGTTYRNYDNTPGFSHGSYGTDEDYADWSLRVGNYNGPLGVYMDGDGDIGIGKVPAAGRELDVDGDINADDIYVDNLYGTYLYAGAGGLEVAGATTAAGITASGQVQAEHLKSTDDLEVAGSADITGELEAGTLDIGGDGIHGGYIAEFDGSVFVDDDVMVLGSVEATIQTHWIDWDGSIHHPYVVIEGPVGSPPFVVEDWDGGDNQSEVVVHQQMMVDAYNFADGDPEDPDITFTDNGTVTWQIGVNRSDDAFVVSPYGESVGNFTERFALVVEEDYVEIGDRAKANDDGAVAGANGRFAADGDAQGEGYIMRRAVTLSDASWYDLYLDGSADMLNVPADSVWTFEALVTITTSGCGKSAGYKIIGLIENNGGTTTLHYSIVTTLYEDDNSWDVQVVANDADDSLGIEVRDAGSGGDAIRAVAILGIAEVTYP